MGNNILLVDNVSKIINKKSIVKDVSFSIDQGEVLGFLGPNGAGKSTTLRMIVGLSKPTSGSIDICGHSITKDYIKAMSNIGCIIEGPDLYSYMSGWDNLKMLASMNEGISENVIYEIIELVGLKNRIKDKVNTYSLGMKQRLGLAQALINDPKLLILDEPTNGLDPAGINEFRNIVKNLAKEKNISVLVSSHLMSEIELMCDKVSIISHGSIIRNATVNELINTKEVVWKLDDNERGKKILMDIWKIDSQISGQKLEAEVDLSKLGEINNYFFKEGIMITYVTNKNRTLEDLFLRLTEGNEIT